ncbi:LysR family transcriptional regulator [Ancylobacter sp. Lp-2]|uniref:LysR substrate-binding domain-containing protein n=1 Tax=Ancylobacter sp. Lp-2 TaxID=2881339 RepID=UPI001E653715|nr:LysR substrate-binding domain-containing protein [Ancylobacter sp. Lp-2]MCB4771019.1 LysR family transcriptional regulator [Ancylobacter sp. Lp-2]
MKKGFSIREVEAFAAVMRHGTVTRAAEFLDISQPGVSKLLAQFEAKAGFTAFRRHRQRLLPTAEAVTLFTEVERSFVSIREIDRVAKDIRDLRTGRLNIGILPALGSGLGPRIIAGFLAEHPDLTATLNVRATQTLIEWVGRGQIDVAIGVTVETENPAIVRRQMPPVPIVCAMRADHRLATKPLISLGDLPGENLISLLPSDPLSVQIQHLCRASGIDLRAGIETNLASAALAFVDSTGGVALIDQLSTAMMPVQGIIVRPFRPQLSIGYSIYRQRGSTPSRPVALFMDHVVRELSGNASKTTSAQPESSS